MSMENAPETFWPLVTQLNALPPGGGFRDEEAGAEQASDLPRGLGVLARAGLQLRRSILISLVLLAVGLVELGVLLLYPEPAALVVWEDRVMKPLVEVP